MVGWTDERTSGRNQMNGCCGLFDGREVHIHWRPRTTFAVCCRIVFVKT